MRKLFSVRLVAAGVAVLLIGWTGAGVDHADARPRFKTRYVYYSVSGRNSRDLFAQMVARGPHVSGQRAFAATTAQSSYGGLLVRGSRCHIRNYRLNIVFTIKLPKARSTRGMSKDDRRRWRQFQHFVRRHELTHRAIWMQCARLAERRIGALSARTCKELDRKAAAVYAALKRRCNRRHDAFDAAEHRRLARHPLIRAARREQVSRRAFAVNHGNWKRGR